MEIDIDMMESLVDMAKKRKSSESPGTGKKNNKREESTKEKEFLEKYIEDACALL